MAAASPPSASGRSDESTDISETFATFDSLPDEILLKIVKLAASHSHHSSYIRPRYDHNYILNVVGNISLRSRILDI